MPRLHVRLARLFKSHSDDSIKTEPSSSVDPSHATQTSVNINTEIDTRSTTSHPSSSYQETRVQLETLPAEIRILILEAADFISVRNLIQSSPVFRRHFNHNRRRILLRHVESSIGYAVLEADISHHSLWAYKDDLFDINNIRFFMQSYQTRRIKSSKSSIAEVVSGVSDTDLFGMMTFHCEIVEPLTLAIFKRLSENYAAEFGKREDMSRPSRSERARIIHAAYRFQTCCNLFGKARRFASHKFFVPFDDNQILSLFFVFFEAWEIECINTILRFAQVTYRGFVRELGSYIDAEDRKLIKAGHLAPYDALDLATYAISGYRTLWACARGLRPLQQIIAAEHYPKQAMACLRNVMNESSGLWLEFGLLSRNNQSRQRRSHWTSWHVKDQKMRRREPMAFKGDHETGFNPPNPPWSWTFVWSEEYSNLYGEYISDYFRDIGYVIWDAKRFEQTDVQEKLRVKWIAEFGSSGAADTIDGESDMTDEDYHG